MKEQKYPLKCVYFLYFTISNNIPIHAVGLQYNPVWTNELIKLCILMDQELDAGLLSKICVFHLSAKRSIRSKALLSSLRQVFLFVFLACTLMYEEYYTFCVGCICCSISSLGFFINSECDRKELQIISYVFSVYPLTSIIVTVFQERPFFFSLLLCSAFTLL